MSTATQGQMVKKFKWWWAWQDGMHERWLQTQARQGLHLRSTDPLGVLMTFERGEPAEVAYRWDYLAFNTDPAYTQLFVDAGWERVVDVAGWCCWRKPVINGKTPEIFTDTASKVRKYRRNLMIAVLSGLPLLVVAAMPPARQALLAEPRVGFLMGTCLLMLAYAVGGLARRICQLRAGGS
ncbi:DUF2812 domain-containing protein [Janthinobacterium sp. RB2R34]|uniref:DUF2812 domain-containing protein n=1 Tax=Janthinobacterium sp. RB2R34 TaxID=3424193 RepID=UPI003F264A39